MITIYLSGGRVTYSNTLSSRMISFWRKQNAEIQFGDSRHEQPWYKWISIGKVWMPIENTPADQRKHKEGITC